MNKIIFLFLLYIFNTLSFYTYDRFNNKAVPVNYGENLIYYTSDIFHSIEYANKNKPYNITNTINKNITLNTLFKNKKLKLRKYSKSLPIIGRD